MHLLVLSAFRRAETFFPEATVSGLNALFGAQCFPTLITPSFESPEAASQCTFWCSVLSDMGSPGLITTVLLVSMHLLVLSAFRLASSARGILGAQSQCTFWCSVLSDPQPCFERRRHFRVSMHLLVLSAFRPCLMRICLKGLSLNAPFGAQCFPTRAWRTVGSICQRSQCTFWCSVLSDAKTIGK